VLSPLLKAHGAGILCERGDERSVSEETDVGLRPDDRGGAEGLPRLSYAARYAGRALNCVLVERMEERPLARKSDGATP
jgi:hypothetical protein